MSLRSVLRSVLRPCLFGVFGGGDSGEPGESFTPIPNGTTTVAPLNSVYFNGLAASQQFYQYPASADFNLPDSDWALAVLCSITGVASGLQQHFVSIGNAGSSNVARLYLNNLAWTGQFKNSANVSTIVTAANITAPAANTENWTVAVLQRNGANLEIITCPIGGTPTTVATGAINSPTGITPAATYPPRVGARTTNAATDNASLVRNHIAWFLRQNAALTTQQITDLAAGKTFTEAGLAPLVATVFSSAAATLPDVGTAGTNTATRNGTPSSRGSAKIAGQGIRIDAASDEVWARVYQRVPGGTSKAVTFTGTYTGSPTGIEARVISGADTQIVGWTPCSIPGVGQWRVTLTIPQGGKYALEVRHTDAPTVLARTVKPFGVGINVLLTGESLADQQFSSASGISVFDREMVSIWNRTSPWLSMINANVPNGSGATELAIALSTALNLPVSVFNGGVSGSKLVTGGTSNWLNPAFSNRTTYTNALAAAGDVEAVFWVQGANDAEFAIPNATPLAEQVYEDGLIQLIPDLRGYQPGRTAAQLPFFVKILGRTTTVLTTGIENWRNIRNAQRDAIGLIANTHHAGSLHDATLTDSVHPDASGYNIIGRREAQALARYLLPGTYPTGMEGATPTGVTFSGNDITITFDLKGATTLRGNTGATGLTGFVVRDGASTLKTISATAIPTATTVRLTMGEAVGAGWSVDYVPLSAVDRTNMLYTDAAVLNMSTNNTVTAQAFRLPLFITALEDLTDETGAPITDSTGAVITDA